MLFPAALRVFAMCSSVAVTKRGLWIVRDSGCPEVHSDHIRPPVEAVSDGDVILERSGRGTYGKVTTDGKSLGIRADGGAKLSLGGVAVRNRAPTRSVLLHGADRRVVRLGSKVDAGANSPGCARTRGGRGPLLA